MNKLRINRKDLYEIEVNDNGDTIVFPLGDISLPFKLEKAYNDINKIQNDLKAEFTIIEKRQDSKGKNDLMTKFADTVRSVGKVKHKVNPAIPTISINFKRKAPKNTPVDTNTINNMVEFLTADLKCANLIPSTFHTTILKLEQKPFTTILSINLKP